MEGRAVGWFSELFSLALYKRSQGRVARQATFGALALIVALGCWAFSDYLGGFVSTHPEWTAATGNLVKFGIPFLLLAAGVWISFRVIHLPSFADFLISVEGEMNKVSWPSRTELFRASLVVMIVIFFLAALLFTYDLLLDQLFLWLGDAVKSIFG